MATTASDELIFSPETYKLDTPTIDGFKAGACSLRFSGSANLDRTSADDVELMRAARLGKEVLLLVRGGVATKSFSLPKDGELAYGFTVRITAVEAAETA